MMRWLVLLLVVVNAGLLAWGQGWLHGPLGLNPQGERDPQRWSAQVRPETVRVLGGAAGAPGTQPAPQASAASTPADASSPLPAASSASVPAVASGGPALRCIEAGPFVGAEVTAAESALAGLPAGSWARVPVEPPASYIVYVGKLADRAALQARRDELRALRVNVEEVTGQPSLEPGLSLGRFERREDAEAALAALSGQGVRAARVVALPTGPAAWRLRLETTDPLLGARVLALAAPALGPGFKPCAGRP
jgi:hypothetical protein